MAAFGFPSPSREGFMEWKASTRPDVELKTWYGIWEPSNGTSKAPLVAVHGGPGVPHEYCLSILDLVKGGRTVIFYEYALSTKKKTNDPITKISQIGCGKSALPEDPNLRPLWRTETFIQELHLLLQLLKLPHFFLWGQSWGGYLTQAFLAHYPDTPGLHGLIVSSGTQDFTEVVESVRSWIPTLPIEAQEGIAAGEAAEDYDLPEYTAAVELFLSRHCLRMDPPPPECVSAFSWFPKPVYATMCGPSELTINGILKNASIADQVHRIKSPVLIIWGQYDELQRCQHIMKDRLTSSPSVEMVELAETTHLNHYEDRDLYNATVEQWMSRVESTLR